MPDEPALLPDGRYDVFVVDATVEVDHADDPERRVVHLDLTIISGEHKGEILTVTAVGLAGEDYDLMGMPGTLTVAGGRPSVDIEG